MELFVLKSTKCKRLWRNKKELPSDMQYLHMWDEFPATCSNRKQKDELPGDTQHSHKKMSCPATRRTYICKTNCLATRSIRIERLVSQWHAALAHVRRIAYCVQQSQTKRWISQWHACSIQTCKINCLLQAAIAKQKDELPSDTQYSQDELPSDTQHSHM